MKRLLIPVLFLFLSALNGGEDNFPQIRQKVSKAAEPIAIHRFEDKGNTCYVAESIVRAGSYGIVGGTSISISCVKAGQ